MSRGEIWKPDILRHTSTYTLTHHCRKWNQEIPASWGWTEQPGSDTPKIEKALPQKMSPFQKLNWFTWGRKKKSHRHKAATPADLGLNWPKRRRSPGHEKGECFYLYQPYPPLKEEVSGNYASRRENFHSARQGYITLPLGTTTTSWSPKPGHSPPPQHVYPSPWLLHVKPRTFSTPSIDHRPAFETRKLEKAPPQKSSPFARLNWFTLVQKTRFSDTELQHRQISASTGVNSAGTQGTKGGKIFIPTNPNLL